MLFKESGFKISQLYLAVKKEFPVVINHKKTGCIYIRFLKLLKDILGYQFFVALGGINRRLNGTFLLFQQRFRTGWEGAIVIV